MCKYVFLRTIWRVPYLSSNQKLLQMQEYTHVLMQLCTGSPPYVPYDAPVPQACKQVLNVCPIETMNIIVLLLPLGQRLSTHKWPCHMEAPLVRTIHGANLIIHIMSLHPFGPLAIPNKNIHVPDVPGANGQIQTMLPKLSMATVTLYTHPAYLGLNKTSQRMPLMEGWDPKEGGNATSTLHSRGSPTKGDKIRTQNLRYRSP